jgi:hypothetical protein
MTRLHDSEQVVGYIPPMTGRVRDVPRYQAGPQLYPPATPLVRFLNIAASMVLLWMLVIAWVLSEFGDVLKGLFNV